MHGQPPARLGRGDTGRRRYKTFMIDEILSKETCDYFQKLSLYSVCPALLVRPKPLHSCAGKRASRPGDARGCSGDARGMLWGCSVDAPGWGVGVHRQHFKPNLSCLAGASKIMPVLLQGQALGTSAL